MINFDTSNGLIGRTELRLTDKQFFNQLVRTTITGYKICNRLVIVLKDKIEGWQLIAELLIS